MARELAVVPDRVMHRSAVVPEGDGARSPAEADLVFGLAVLVVHDREQFPAFCLVEADDPRVLAEVDPEDLLAGLAVGSHDGVGDDRVVVPGTDQRVPVVMGDVEVIEPPLDVLRQPLVSEARVDPDGVAADVGQVDRAEHSTPRGNEPPAGVGVVGVPALSLLLGEVFRVLVLIEGLDVVDGRDLVGVGLRRARVGVERAELPRECGVLVAVEILIAEEDDLVLQDRPPDLVPPRVTERVTEVHAADLGADRGLERAHDDVRFGYGGHSGSLNLLN
jgi:hypothetical protein